MASPATETPTTFMEFYNELWSLRDRRMDDWPLLSSPWPTITLCAAYFYISIGLGPTLMKDRPAFELKRTIQAYNIFQVVISAYIMFEACAAGWFSSYNWICQDVDRNPDPNSEGMRMARASYLYFLTKFVEFADTFFFIARKKFTHVSKLQLLHHGLMPIFSYMLVRWLPGGHETFGGTFNCLVHVLMYSYYFLASLGPHMQKYLWWKKYLTTFQMFQFVCVFSKSLVLIFGFAECGYPWQFSCVSAFFMFLFFCLFADFYSREYIAKAQARKNKVA
uniref:Elongation of very long chain fatty acids protein n=1 Tax=Paracyclopina nana TaxID=565004 RepID=A0A1L3THX0_PARNA|nr:elongase2 [Paracyclopina nana]